MENCFINTVKALDRRHTPLVHQENVNWHDSSSWKSGLPDGSQDARVDYGSVKITNSDAEAKHLTVGFEAAGSVDHSAHKLTTGTLILGMVAGSEGTYNLSGAGSLSADAMIVGYNGTGGFIQDTTKSVAVSGDMIVGKAGNGGSGYILKNGDLSIGGNLYLGDQVGSLGSVYQEAGTVRVNGSLIVARSATPEGYGCGYVLADGSLTVGQASTPVDMKVGAAGNGTVWLGGNSRANSEFTLYGNLCVGETAGGDGQIFQYSSNAKITGSLTLGRDVGQLRKL